MSTTDQHIEAAANRSDAQQDIEISRIESPIVHWILLILCSTVILFSFIMEMPDDNHVSLAGTTLPEVCTAKRLFHIGCPGCGLTRAFISISQGNWARAWWLNQASFLLYFLILIQIPYRAWQLIRIRSGRAPLSDSWAVWYFAAFGLVLVVQWLVRVIAQAFA